MSGPAELKEVEGSWVDHTLALGQRLFSRRPKPGQDFDRRAAAYLRRLSDPSKRVAFKIALENLEQEMDLLDEEAALHPEPLALQKRLIDLMGSEPLAERIGRKMLADSPVAKLVAAMFAQATADRASDIKISFGAEGAPRIRVSYQVRSLWREGHVIPPTLRRAVRGACVRMEVAGYHKIFPYLTGRWPAPRNVQFSWPDTATFQINLGYREADDVAPSHLVNFNPLAGLKI